MSDFQSDRYDEYSAGWESGSRKDEWYRPAGSETWTSYGPRGPQGQDSFRGSGIGSAYGSYTGEPPRSRDDAGKTKRTKRVRRAGIVVLAVLLLVSFLYYRFSDVAAEVIFTDDGFSFRYSDGTDDRFGNSDYDPSGELPAGEYPDDFNEFFDSFFTQDEKVENNVKIEKTGEQFPFEVDLYPVPESPEKQLTLQELYASCADSVVSIKGFMGEKVGYYWGTGVVLTEDGLILTNTHVINGCDSAEVIDSAGNIYEAKLVGADTISDLAVLKTEASGLQPAVFGESDGIVVGQNVAAIGNPLGDTFTGTLTDGIISAIERDISYNGRNMTLLQTNTALNEGNSGGPLFNMYGQVIGITNMKMMSTLSSIEGIGFAIPSSTVKNVVNSIITCGEVRGRPSIGITVGAIPENVAKHYEMPEGLYVSAVSEGSDAEKKGIRPGDVLTAVDGEPVTDVNVVSDKKDAKNVGDIMLFSIWREGKEMEIEVELVDTIDVYK